MCLGWENSTSYHLKAKEMQQRKLNKKIKEHSYLVNAVLDLIVYNFFLF